MLVFVIFNKRINKYDEKKLNSLLQVTIYALNNQV
jgi:hypothetical protein